VLRALLLFAILLGGALAIHNVKQLPGMDPNGHQSAPHPDVIGGLDPDGAQSAPHPDVIGGLNPNGTK
jgi:hypothetical protein